jgi:hypothetical protein
VLLALRTGKNKHDIATTPKHNTMKASRKVTHHTDSKVIPSVVSMGNIKCMQMPPLPFRDKHCHLDENISPALSNCAE